MTQKPFSNDKDRYNMIIIRQSTRNECRFLLLTLARKFTGWRVRLKRKFVISEKILFRNFLIRNVNHSAVSNKMLLL